MMRGLDPTAAPQGTPGDAVLQNRLSPRVDPTRPAEAQQAPDQGGQQAPPEMQEAYQEFVGRASMVLWSKPVRDSLGKAVTSSKDPISPVAEYSAQASLKAIRDSAKEGRVIPAAVTLHGGQEVVMQAAEIAKIAGRPLEPQEIETAYYLALDRGRATAQKEGLLDMEAVGKDSQMIEGLKQNGQMEQVWQAIRQASAQGANRPKLPTPKGV